MCNFPVAQCQLAWKRLRETEAMVISLFFEYWMAGGALQICQIVGYSVVVSRGSVQMWATLPGLFAGSPNVQRGVGVLVYVN